MTDHCSPYCPFLACARCTYQGSPPHPSRNSLSETRGAVHETAHTKEAHT